MVNFFSLVLLTYVNFKFKAGHEAVGYVLWVREDSFLFRHYF